MTSCAWHGSELTPSFSKNSSPSRNRFKLLVARLQLLNTPQTDGIARIVVKTDNHRAQGTIRWNTTHTCPGRRRFGLGLGHRWR
jgi:hypothetical protein